MPKYDIDPENVAVPPGWERDENDPHLFVQRKLEGAGDLITEDVGYHVNPDVDRLLREIAALMPSLTPTERIDVMVAFETEWCAECGEPWHGGEPC